MTLQSLGEEGSCILWWTRVPEPCALALDCDMQHHGRRSATSALSNRNGLVDIEELLVKTGMVAKNLLLGYTTTLA